MRSARLEDTTAAARIREAAIVRFGRQGFARTSVREIAADAGVSAALVIHHYGSKDALRETCDEWLTKQLLGDASRAAGSDFAATMREWAAAPDRFGVYIDYFAMMVSDGTEAGNRLFDRLVQDTAVLLEAGVADGSVNKSSDPEMRALLVTMHGLAPLLLRDHVARLMGTPLASPDAIRRLTVPTLELYTHGLYPDARLLDAAKALIGETPTTTEGPESPEGRA